jgi:uncharacterized delta-60 repeat protein
MKVMNTFLVSILILAAAVVSHAQTLDSTFGTGGSVRTDFAGNIDQANAVAIQPNGQIIAAGSSFSNSKTVEDFIVARYNANGSLDSSFGAGGIVTTDFGTTSDKASAVAIGPDGKIVALGLANRSAAGATTGASRQ